MTIKIWDLNDNFKSINTISENWSTFYSFLSSGDDKLFSGSSDNLIMIYDYKEKTVKCIHKLDGQTNSIYCLELLLDGKLVSASRDNSIKIRDPYIDYTCVRTLIGHTGPIYCLLLLNGILIWEEVKIFNIFLREPKRLTTTWLQNDRLIAYRMMPLNISFEPKW